MIASKINSMLKKIGYEIKVCDYKNTIKNIEPQAFIYHTKLQPIYTYLQTNKARAGEMSIEKTKYVVACHKSLQCENDRQIQESIIDTMTNNYALYKKNSKKKYKAKPWVIDNNNDNDIKLNKKQLKLKRKYPGYSDYVYTDDAFKKREKERMIIESKRLYDVLMSIRRNGYNLKSKDKIGGILLLGKNDWTWQISNGNHRVSAMHALGYEKIPVLIKYVVYEQDYKYWPLVREGLYSEEEALEYFLSCMKG